MKTGLFSLHGTRHNDISRKLAATVFFLITIPSRAADPQPYAVAMAKTGNAAMDQALVDSSRLVSLEKSAPTGPFALTARAREDADRFLTVLHSFGYYKGRVNLSIAGLALDDPSLLDRLDKAPAVPPVQINIAVTPGPLFHLRRIEIQGSLPEKARARLDLLPGVPAVASEVLDARARLLNALLDEGYPLAKVDQPIATLVPDSHALDVVYPVDAGPRADLGKIALKGLRHVNESFARQQLLIATGERFNPARIEQTRQALIATGVFSSVQIKPLDRLDAQGRLPIEIQVTERPQRVVAGNADYATDLGGNLSASWRHRNLFGNGEQLSLTAGVTQLGGNSTTGFGYNATAAFVKPDFLMRDQSLQASVGAIKQSLVAYDQRAVTAALSVNRKLSKHWAGQIGLDLEQEQITQEGVDSHYFLLGLPMALKYDDTNNLLDPTKGLRATLSLTPTQALGGSGSSSFVILQASGSTYLDLGEPGRSVLALRGLIGDAEGARQADLPPDKRFYAGGSATVRGFKYQSIGPRFPDNKPQGGVAMAAGTVEFRQRILDKYGAVAFVDGGQVAASGQPFTGRWGVGVGVGARYYTSFGPIRLDLAVPVNPQPGSGSFELYLGIGQAF